MHLHIRTPQNMCVQTNAHTCKHTQNRLSNSYMRHIHRHATTDESLELHDQFNSILSYVLPLQEVALHQSPPAFSVLCCPCSYRSLLPHNVIVLVLQLILRPLMVFHSGDMSSPFPFRIGYVLDNVSHSGSLPSDGVADSVFKLDI